MSQPLPGSPGHPADFGSEIAEPEVHLSEYLQILMARWRLAAMTTLLTLAVALMQYATTPKEYRATTSILIERRVGVPVTNAQDAIYENYFNMEFYPTQYRLLSSRGLCERVVQNLRLDQDPTFNPGRAAVAGNEVRTTTAADDEAALAGLAGRVQGGLQVNPIQSTQLVEISYTSASPELAARIANGVAEAYIDWGIETRATLVGKTSVFLGQQVEALKQEIQDKENSLLAYSRRADIVPLDSGGNVLVQRLEALNNDYMRSVSERINREVRLRELEAASDERAAEILEDPIVSQLRTELMQMEREYASKLSVYKPEWPAMVELKSRIEKSRQTLTGATRDALGKARENARAEYQTALRQQGALAGEIERLKSENQAVSSASVEYTNLKVEVSTRRTLLDELMRRQSETGVSSRMQENRESNVRVVDRALVPGGPFRPSIKRSLSLGGGTGLLLGIGLIFLLHYMDRTVKSTDEIERLLGLPVLGVIPDVASDAKGYGLRGRYGYGYGYGHGYGYGYGYGYGEESGGKERSRKSRKRRASKAADEDLRIELLPHLRPRLAVSEAYRAVRTALLLSTAGGLKLVVVTSSMPGEGKTSTAANLAVVLAQLGKNTLLVDGDLRKPRVHEIFKVSNRSGLVSYLTGSAEPQAIVFRSEMPNLYLSPAGPSPPNPSELLASARMRDFLKMVRERFDIVIVDSAPSLAVTDATLLGSMADGVVLCMRAGVVQRRDARACRDRLLQAEVKILGAVLNRYRSTERRYRARYKAYEAYGSTPEPKAEVAAL